LPNIALASRNSAGPCVSSNIRYARGDPAFNSPINTFGSVAKASPQDAHSAGGGAV
jgi:hypothetical protein